VILGNAQLLLDDLHLLAQEELALLRRYPFVPWLVICPCSSATSRSRRNRSSTFSMRGRSGNVSRTSCNCAPLAVVRAAEKSASLPGWLGLKLARYCFSS